MPTPPTPKVLETLRARARQTLPEETCVLNLLQSLDDTKSLRKTISRQANTLATQVRNAPANVMQQFLNEYEFSSREGTALMCLAEAYLRTPDAPSLDDLVKDKVSGKAWNKNKAHPPSLLMSASHWSLMFTGRLLQDLRDSRGIVASMQKLVQRLGEPIVRVAIAKAMKLMGGQFVLGETMTKAVKRAQPARAKRYRFSYDMLGEAARCEEDAQLYLEAYRHAIRCLKPLASPSTSPHDNCGISVKLSAIHPRYELGKKQRVEDELVPRLVTLVQDARNANIPITLDAEESDRSDLLLSVLEATIGKLDLLEQRRKKHKTQNGKKWDGFGIVLQAYRTNTYAALDFVFELARQRQRKIAVRLVKGAYWDAEIKHAQTLGVDRYPVFTRKCSTDLSYLACARKLMAMRSHIFPQFGTHNAHTAAAILTFAEERNNPRIPDEAQRFELQRIHGMGEALHEQLQTTIRRRHANGTLPAITTRIYAPVGIHQDLLAYLVRRMLENGANSSFVHQVLDRRIPIAELVRDPIALVEQHHKTKSFRHPKIVLPPALFAPRKNARGWNLNDIATQQEFLQKISTFMGKTYEAHSHLGNALGNTLGSANSRPHTIKTLPPRPCFSPADGHKLGSVREASEEEILRACQNLRTNRRRTETNHGERAKVLENFADLLEDNAFEAVALLSREAGKTLWDGIAEVREAVDFARFYASEARSIFSERNPRARRDALGIVVCIAPWNFSLAIFCGQISAALACGNAVIAKPAEQTPLIADLAVRLFYRAGLPRSALACLFGTGERVGKNVIEAAKPDAVCFTGSAETARLIDHQLARQGNAVLVAETGGINAMVVDSTALAEQVVRDVLVSAFQSSGQRCSALRLLFVQKDLAKRLLPLLVGATHELSLHLPWRVESDMGPLIDREAQKKVQQWCRAMSKVSKSVSRSSSKSVSKSCNRRADLLYQGQLPKELRKKGFWMPPHIVRIQDAQMLSREIFGPVLHVQTYGNQEQTRLLSRINAMGYGLTFGIHSRIDSRIASAVAEARCGNIYVNRNQIGAVVGCQPFGGEECSGTGPKAGSRDLLLRLSRANPSEPLPAYRGITLPPLRKIKTLQTGRAGGGWGGWRSLLAPAIGIFDSKVESATSSSTQDLSQNARQDARQECRQDSRQEYRQELWQELWTVAPERLARLEKAVRAWKPASARSCAQALLAKAREAYATDGILPGTTGERNRLYTTARGTVACCGERDFLSLQVLVAFAFGNRVVCAQTDDAEGADDSPDPRQHSRQENGQDPHEEARLAALVALAPHGHFRQLSLQDFLDEGLRLCHVALFDGEDGARRRALRARLASLPDRRRLLLSLNDETSLLAAQRVVSEDTTASGGNASLLLAASKG